MKKDLIDKLNRNEVRNDKFLLKVLSEFADRQSKENLFELFQAATQHGLTRISLNEMEVIDPDKNRDEHGWPAIWEVPKNCGINGGCGNSAQHQIKIGYFLPKYFGMWDIKEKKKIGIAKSLFGKDLGTDNKMNLETEDV